MCFLISYFDSHNVGFTVVLFSCHISKCKTVLPSLTLVCMRPISLPVCIFSPTFTYILSRLEYRLKYKPCRIKTTLLLPWFVIKHTSPSNTALALAPAVVVMSIPLFFVVIFFCVGCWFKPYLPVIMPFSVGNGNLPLFCAKVPLSL